jgi:hypothetical protein
MIKQAAATHLTKQHNKTEIEINRDIRYKITFIVSFTRFVAQFKKNSGKNCLDEIQPRSKVFL